MMILLMQKLWNLVGMILGRMILAESKILMQVIQRVLVQLLGSEAVPPKLLAIGNWLVIFQSSTFVFDFLILCFAFSSPVAKMPRTSASGDDTVVGQFVASTIVDPSNGTRVTLTASSSDVTKTVDAGKRAVIVKPTRKFGINDLALKRAPT